MTTNTAPATTPAWATLWTVKALAELPADITTATPAQVDEAIRTLELDAATTESRFEGAVNAIRNSLGYEARTEYQGYGRARRQVTTWTISGVDAVAAARALPADTASKAPMAGHYGKPATVGAALAAFETLIATHTEITERAADLHAEYDRRGSWTRYFRVDNTDGHVHKSTSCRETYPTTRWNWPTQLSGADSEGVVAAAGALTCLTCFPEVRGTILEARPIDATAFETREQTAARAEREDAAKAKLADRIAKGVTADGKPLMVHEPRFSAGDNYAIKTLRAAELRYVEWAAAATYYAGTTRFADLADEYRGSADQVLAALAAKRGETVEQTTAHYAAKVAKKANDRAF